MRTTSSPLALAATALTTLCLLASATLPAQRDSGGQRGAESRDGAGASFRALTRAWEADNQRPSRLALFADIDALGLPPLPPRLLEAVRAAANDPLGAPLPPARELQRLLDRREPAIRLLSAAWERVSSGAPEIADPLDPRLDFASFEALSSTCLLLACRARARAEAGDLDGALADASTVWLAGHTLQARADSTSFAMAFAGVQLRSAGLRQMRAIVEARGANLPRETVEKLAQMFLSEGPRRGGVTAAAKIDLNPFFARLRELSPDDDIEIDLARKALFDAIDALAAEPPARNREALAEGLEPAIREANTLFPPLRQLFDRQLFVVPNVPDALLREAAADALENALAATLLVLGANERHSPEPATLEQVGDYAGFLADRFADPFTGELLLIENAGEGRVLVKSAGPDGAFDPEPAWEWLPEDGLDAPGDIVVRTPAGDWHGRYKRGRVARNVRAQGSRAF